MHNIYIFETPQPILDQIDYHWPPQHDAHIWARHWFIRAYHDDAGYRRAMTARLTAELKYGAPK